ncbi:MAG: hypothetical protein IJQ06_09230 [Paludibacteraceae bacterium]|nr:hypothetical protein [Paludibacteraceae bacterium]
MKRILTVLLLCAVATVAKSQSQAPPKDTHIIDGLTSVATIAGETKEAGEVQDSSSVTVKPAEIPLWKQKLYYGYNFDIYFHHDSKKDSRENGWSIALTPEIGWKLKERVYLGMRFGGSYANYKSSFLVTEIDTSYYTDLRVHVGSWEVAPYMRYKMKSLFNDKVGIWLEAHLYTGMDFPRVTEGSVGNTDYDGLRHSVTYGFQVSPVITYQFNRKSTFQIFFSILSLGYSGTTYFYGDRREYSNDIIIFSGKLSNLISNQFTPGLYGLKFGVQKSF